MATPMQWRRRRRWSLLLLTALAALVVTGGAFGYVTTDQQDYSPGSLVTLSGGNDSSGNPGYAQGNTVNVNATNIDTGWTGSCSTTITASDGSWSCAFNLSTDTSQAVGSYTYTATSTDIAGNPISESGTFTDSIGLNISGTDGIQHQPTGGSNPRTNEQNLGMVAAGSTLSLGAHTNCTTTPYSGLKVSASGVGTGTQAFSLAYATPSGDTNNNSTLSPLTTLSETSGSVTGSSDFDCVGMDINTTGLAVGTYHGTLAATGTGATTGYYLFKFSVATPTALTLGFTPLSPTPSESPFYVSGNLHKSGDTSTVYGNEPVNLTGPYSSSSDCANGGGTAVGSDTTSSLGNWAVTTTAPASSGTYWYRVDFTGDNAHLLAASYQCNPVTVAPADSTAPSISLATLKGGTTTPASADGTSGWFNAASVSPSTALDLKATATDTSGIKSLSCSDSYRATLSSTASSSSLISQTYTSPYTSPQSATASSLIDGIHSVSCSATDGLGNATASGSETTGTYMVDLTPPSVSGAPTTSPNLAGWYKTNVSIHWTCSDATSGVASCPANGTISSEGSGETTSSGSVFDNAGNSASANSSPAVNIDKTAPSGSISSPSDGTHVHGSSVSLSATASDNSSGSGVATVQFQYNDGTNWVNIGSADTPPSPYGATWDTHSLADGRYSVRVEVTDVAGNVFDSTPITLVVDNTPPLISFTVLEHGSYTVLATEAASGWYNIASSGTGGIDLTATATDTSNVASLTCYDGLIQIIDTSGTSGTLSNSSPVVLGDGPHSISCSATDGLGNSGASLGSDGYASGPPSTANATYNVDQTAPSVSGTPTTSANGNGWYNTNVAIHWTCTDTTSGVVASGTGSCPANSPISTEGTNETVNSGDVYDIAGNHSSADSSPAVNIDKTPPTVAYTSASPAPNANGWNNTDVTATFTATDALSGFAGPSTTTTGTATTSGQGSAVTVGSPAFTDLAGNTAAAGTATSDPFKIDEAAPTVSVTGVSNGATYTLGSVPTAGCSTIDTLSGVQTYASLSTSGGPVGSITATCSGGKDNADNTADPVSATYTVDYNWTGFFQPVNNPTDPAPCNTVKAGSAIPVKFSLGGYQGMSILASGSPNWTVGSCSGTDDAITSTETVTAGSSSLNYDATSDQYIYVWKTDKTWAGKSMRLTVTLNDGTSHYARFTFTK